MNTLMDQIGAGQTHLVVDCLAETESPDLSVLIRAAAQYGDLTAMKLLLARGATLSQLHPFAVNTAAFHGADPSATDANGETPLMWASWCRRTDILGFLRGRRR